MDLVFVMKDETGKLVNVETKDLEGEVRAAYQEVARRTNEWFSEADIEFFTEDLPKNSSALLLLIENVWAIKFKEALMAADAELIDMGRIPPETVKKTEMSLMKEVGV
jgi:hypothetical protein